MGRGRGLLASETRPSPPSPAAKSRLASARPFAIQSRGYWHLIMKRREFLQTSLAAGGAAGLSAVLDAAAAQTSTPTREFYELRLYHLRRGPKQQLFDDFYREAALPAWNRAGVSPVGVFDVTFGPDSPTKYVLLVHPSLESVFTAAERLRADAEFLKAGSEFIKAPPTDPAYVRVESSLMVAFEGMPKLEVPALRAANKPRLFELRTYEAHSKTANKKKIEMFNVGEIAIFRRTGLTPVFFGETLIGPKLPNLTYLLVFEDLAAREANWGRFVRDPEWRKLSTTPGYTDPEILTNISNVFLRPTAYSQV
jgi:hypothetical protein